MTRLSLNRPETILSTTKISGQIPAFLLGFMAFSFQIILLREFCAHFYGNEASVGLILAGWLFWGGAGSLVSSKIKFRLKFFAILYPMTAVLFALSLGAIRFSRFILGILPGEQTGLLPVVIFGIALGMLSAFPLGILFVLNIRSLKNDLASVFLMESFGSAISGVITSLILIPRLSNWQAAAVIGTFSAAACFIIYRRRLLFISWVIAVLFMAGLYLLDVPSQSLSWKPYILTETRDTPYGRLQVIQIGEQVSVYQNHLPVFTFPDLEAAEEAVHFSLLQKPLASDILLIGGGLGGGIEEILKYPESRIEYVEIDPDLFVLVSKNFPERFDRIMENPRVQYFSRDGRRFLECRPQLYDMIILNLPPPSTVQINRFYTREFFSLARSRLREGGIFSFKLESSENFISPILQKYLATLRQTLREEFKEVKIVPGASNIFLASMKPLTLNPAVLSSRIEKYSLETRYITPTSLEYRLSEERIHSLEQALDIPVSRLNSDQRPISSFLHSELWSSQFGRRQHKIFQAAGSLSRFWLIELPLFLYLMILSGTLLMRRSSAIPLMPLVSIGAVSMISELIILLLFQIAFGYIYQSIALLFTCFMVGLAVGALVERFRKLKVKNDLFLLQGGMIIFTAAVIRLPELLQTKSGYFLALFVLGFITGAFFIAANRLYPNQHVFPGLGYALDLGGSAAGALMTLSLLVPLFGIFPVMQMLIILNFCCYFYLLFGLCFFNVPHRRHHG